MAGHGRQLQTLILALVGALLLVGLTIQAEAQEALPESQDSSQSPNTASSEARNASSEEEAELLRSLGETRVFRNAETKRVNLIGGSEARVVDQSRSAATTASPETAARAHLNKYGKLFGIRDQARELRRERTKKERKGRSVVRFQQVYKHVPILGGELNVHVDDANNLLAAAGEVLPDIKLDIRPGVNAQEAQEEAIGKIAKDRDLEEGDLEATQPELWIYDPTLLGEPGQREPRLVWRMDVAPDKEVVDFNELVLVDAKIGVVVLNFDQVEHARDRKTYTANGTSELQETLVCDESNPSCTGGDADAQNAHLHAGDTYDFYNNYHGRDGIGGEVTTMTSTVHYCPDSNGDGTPECPYRNGFWNGHQVVLGDGMTSDDWLGHELTHGVTRSESDLFYYYQAGAINESLSDVWGEFVDLTNGRGNDSASVRWLIFEDGAPRSEGAADGRERNMRDPTLSAQGAQPDRMQSDHYVPDESDSGGVHYNSGVNNKAAYLMTDGTGGEPGGTFNGKTITGLGITKVAKIYYEAQTNLLTSASDYSDLHAYLQQACANLVGTSGIVATDCQEVEDAVEATEMHLVPDNAPNPEAPVCDTDQQRADLFFDDFERYTTNPDWNYTPPWKDSGDYATSGKYHMWGQNIGTRSDGVLVKSMALTIPTDKKTYMHFKHSYGFEDDNQGTYYDGGVLEYSDDRGSTWKDLGAKSTHNGYEGTISSSRDNPLAGRSAFVEESNGYISSRVDLSSLAGESDVLFRFVIGTDSAVGDRGWFIDDVRFYTCETDTTSSPGDTTRMSLDSFANQGNGSSGGPSVSADGRYVAFVSDADNLVSGDTNAATDIFVRDRQAGTTERVSVDSSENQANDLSYYPSISADGRYVAFYSYAGNLVAGDTNGNGTVFFGLDVFVRDRQAGTTERVSVDSSENQANDYSLYPSISSDGRFVAFVSNASNLVQGDTNHDLDVFVRDRQAGTTERVSVDSPGNQANGSNYYPSINSDGRYVAFESYASNLVASDTNGFTDIFVRDRQAGTTERVSVDSSEEEGNDYSLYPSISADGRYVTFNSYADNLVAGDTNGSGYSYGQDVFVRDRQAGTTERVSVDSSEKEGNNFLSSYYESSISFDGRYVAFVSYASNLVASDTNGFIDIFVRDRQAGTTERVSADSPGNQANGSSDAPFVSADGRYVAFNSDANNLVADDTNGRHDVFVHERDDNTPPVANDQSVTTNEFTAKTITLTASDADGDPLAYSVLSDSVHSGPQHGTLSGAPPNLSYTPDSDYEGYDTFSFKVNDGMADSNAGTVSITVDDTAPETTIDSDPSSTPTSTSASFTFSSTETGSTFRCSLDNAAFTSCTSPKSYSNLSDGSHTFRVEATDAAGNTDDTPASRTWMVDTTAPDAPIITSPANNSYDKDGTFTLSGTAEASSTIEIFEGSTSKGTATTTSSGNWSKTLSGVSEDTHTYTVKARDVAGNTSASSDALTVTVDKTTPSAPVIDAPDNNSYDTDGSVTLSGTAEADSTVEIFDRSTSKGTTTADTSSGNWSKTLTGVTDGSHIYTAKAKDAAGNTSSASNARTVTVDKTAPTVSSVTPSANATGVAVSDNVTATFSEAMDSNTLTSTTLALTKQGDTSPVAATATYDSTAKKATLNPDENLDVNTTYTATVKSGSSGVTDAAGNPLATDKVWSFTTRIGAPANDNFASAQQLTGTGATVTGTNQGATKEVGEPNHAGYAGGKSVWYEWTPQESGTATIDLSGSNLDTLLGVYTGSAVDALTKVASDDESGDGSTSKVSFAVTTGTTYRLAVDGYNSASGSITLNLQISDTTPPDAPAITVPANNSYDTDGDITLSGTAEAGSTVELFDSSISNGTTTTDSSGNWGKTLHNVSAGSHTYSAKATDASGNASAESDPVTVIVDKTAPSAVSNFTGTAGNGKVDLSWTNPASDFDKVRLLRSTSSTATGSEPNATQTQVYEGAASSYADTSLTNGTKYYYTVFTRDAAGNWSSAATASATPTPPDTTPPTVTSTNPTANAKNVPLTLTQTGITTTFSEKMKAGTFSRSTIKLEKVVGKGKKQKITPVTLSVVSLGGDGKTLTIKPSAPFAKKGIYKVTVTTGVKDESDNALTSAKSWQFTMAKKY